MRLSLPMTVALVGLISWQAATLTRAEEKRLAVRGTGKIDVRPDTMEVSATVTASGELTTDALKKFRANRRRGVEAINKLKIKGLEIKGSGVSVISNAAVQQFQQRFGNMQQGSASQTTFSETLTFAVPGIDHMTNDQVQDLATKILDAAKDAGLSLGHPNEQNPYVYNYNSYKPQIVFFRFANGDQAREKALDLAAKDARSKAELMAKRLNVGVGKVVQIRDAASRQFVINQPNMANADSTNDSSPALHNMTIEAFLSVEFEIVN